MADTSHDSDGEGAPVAGASSGAGRLLELVTQVVLAAAALLLTWEEAISELLQAARGRYERRRELAALREEVKRLQAGSIDATGRARRAAFKEKLGEHCRAEGLVGPLLGRPRLDLLQPEHICTFLSKACMAGKQSSCDGALKDVASGRSLENAQNQVACILDGICGESRWDPRQRYGNPARSTAVDQLVA